MCDGGNSAAILLLLPPQSKRRCPTFAFLLTFPATEYHLGLLKAKLAKYRAQLLEPSKSAAAKGEGFDVMKSGDARVALIGFPSVGKVSANQRTAWVQWAGGILHPKSEIAIVTGRLVLFECV